MILKEPFKKSKSIFKHNKIMLLLCTSLFIYISCNSDDETPDRAPTTKTTATKNNKSITITNNNNDPDGDITTTKITATKDGANFTDINENFSLNVFNKTFTDLPAGSYIISTITTANGKSATDTEKAITIEPNNIPPVVKIDNLTSDDTTNTVSGTVSFTDSDGTVSEKTLNGRTTDGELIAITFASDGSFSHTFTNQGKTIDKLVATGKDNDGATVVETKNLNPTISVDAPATLGNPNPNVDENSTADIPTNPNDPDGIDSLVLKDAATNPLAEYFDLMSDGKLKLKTGKTLNHEVKSVIAGVMTIKDSKGNNTDITVTVSLNDLAEQQTVDIYADGGLLPNGEAYAITADEAAAGENLAVMHYNHGGARRTEAQIQAELDAADGYGNAHSMIASIYFTGDGPKHSTGVNMVAYDSATNEMVIYAADSSELKRTPKSNYAHMMRIIADRNGTNETDDFARKGTVLYTTWINMIINHTQQPEKLAVGCDNAIQKKLTE